jgi:hypothetical protein
MICYNTVYEAGKKSYVSFVYAKDQTAAKTIITRRNIGETIVGELIRSSRNKLMPLPSTFYTKRQLIKCMHTLTFYGWIASRAGIDVTDFLLRDDGALHEIMHELHFPKENKFRESVHMSLLMLETSIPGLSSYSEIPSAG